MEPIISVSGLRGVVGESLTPEVAMRYACAYAAEIGPGDIVLARDGRDSGPMLARVIQGALSAVGRNVLYADVAATPSLGILVREHRAAGGIQITASHNPPPYNGLKLFSREGRVIPAGAGQQVIRRFRDARIDWVPFNRLGEMSVIEDTVNYHWLLIEQIIDGDRIRERRFKVLLDSNHGSGSVMGRFLLERLHCEIWPVGEWTDGRFAHPPEPTAENVANIAERVRSAGADVGFCQDPDADRLAVLDERGRYLGEEHTLALCVNHVLGKQPGPIVTNCSTSRMSEDLAQKYGVPFFRSAVGEANVVDAMLAHGAVLGGEGNGGVIDPRVGLVRDSFVGIALLLDAMAERGKRVSELAEELPRYEICKTSLTLPPEKIPLALDTLEKHFADAGTDRLDGLRLDWPGKWLLVRASNTEPIVRSIAEAPTRDEAERLCAEANRVMGSL